MDVSLVNSDAQRQTTSTPDAAPSTSQITSDFEVFLQMLTAQMQYQDPLNPIDSTDYATQLATFSNVEQAVLTNDLLKDLTTQLTSSGLADMAAWVGKEARSTAPVNFQGTPLTLPVDTAPGANRAELVVTNTRGQEVQRLPIDPSTETITWAGVADGGAPLPMEAYQFNTVSYQDGVVLGQMPVSLYRTVTEVRVEDGQTQLIFKDGTSVSSNEVTAIRSSD